MPGRKKKPVFRVGDFVGGFIHGSNATEIVGNVEKIATDESGRRFLYVDGTRIHETSCFPLPTPKEIKSQAKRFKEQHLEGRRREANSEVVPFQAGA